MSSWPFKAPKTMPGMTVDSDGRTLLEFTQEEKAAVEAHFKLMNSILDQHKPIDGPEGEWYFPGEEVDCFVAVGLWYYAEDMILGLLTVEDPQERTSLLDKAFGAVVKAYSFCPVPILIYDAGWLTEMSGKPNNAADTFREFLSAQERYEPKPTHEPLLCLREVDYAIASAKRALSTPKP
jgi:hypothetical protein